MKSATTTTKTKRAPLWQESTRKQFWLPWQCC